MEGGEAISTGSGTAGQFKHFGPEAPVSAEEFRASFLMIKSSLQSRFFPPGLTFNPVIKPSNKTVSFCNGQATEKRLLERVSELSLEEDSVARHAG